MGKGCHGQAHRAAAQAHALHGPFHGDGVGLDEELLVDRQQPELDLHGPAYVAGQGGYAEFVHQAGRHVGGDADVALAAAEHEGHGGGVVARIDREAFGHLADQPLRALDVAGGFLDADDARHLGQAQHRVVLHIGDGAARHVIEDGGQVAHGLGDRLEVQVLALLGGLVVVGHDLQLRVGAHLLGEAGEFDGLGRGVGAAAGHDGHALRSLFDGHADDLAVLLDVDGGRFAGGAHHADAVGAFCDMPVDQLAQGGVVHAAVLVHGGDEGDDAAGEGGAGRGHVHEGKR